MAVKKMGVLKEQPVATAAVEKENDYEAEQHARDLMRAGEILNDPKKMKKAMKHVKKQKAAIRSVGDIKAFHQAKYGTGSHDESDAAEMGESEKED